jgi:hypothetical protein
MRLDAYRWTKSMKAGNMMTVSVILSSIMRTYQYLIGSVLKGVVAMSAAALVLAGCATVDLGPDANAPQVRMPGDARSASTRPANSAGLGPQAAPVQTMPVAPEDAAAQPAPDGADNGAPAPDIPGTDTSAADAHPADVSPAGTQLMTLTTRPDGANAVPPTPSGATAQIDLLYDTGTRLLRWKAQWAGLSSPITVVNFYGPAAPGQQGQPTLIWPGPFGLRYEGRATLTPQQATDLIGGLWYVSIGTVNYPDGEIRGQVRVVY